MRGRLLGAALCVLLGLTVGVQGQGRFRLRIAPAAETASLIPADSMTTWDPGLAIPTRSTSCATIAASTYSDGAVEASAGIQAAIDACPVGQVVTLGAGTFLLNDRIEIDKGITLRGAGVGTTTLQKTDIAQETIILVGPSAFPGTDDTTAVDLTADAVKGAYSVTVTDAAGFAVGQFVKLDEADFVVGPQVDIASSVTGNPGIVNTSTAHNLTTGDPVLIYDQTGITSGSYTVTVTDADTFTIPVAITGAGAVGRLHSMAGSAATFVNLPPRLYEDLYDVLQSDRLSWTIYNPTRPGHELPVPAGLTYWSRSGRPIAELKEVVAVDTVTDTVTFADPIHISYRMANDAQLVRYTGSSVHIQNAGVEDLSLRGGGDGNIMFLAAANSWAKNIECTQWGSACVDIRHGFRIEVRDSWIHDTVHPYPGGGGYAFQASHGSAELLLENTVISGANKMMVMRSAGAGSVVGYNYVENGVIGNQLGWMETGINASHMVGGHHVLFEGNEAFNYDSDGTWGSAIYMTIYRNHLSGFRRDHTTTDNPRTAGLMFSSWWHNFVGNVLGESGAMTGWIYEDPGDGTYGTASSQWGISQPFIWKMGYDPGNYHQDPDPKVRSTMLRDGNFDYLTNAVAWDRTPQALPDSLYLSAKPDFFGTDTWPWVEPLEATKLYTLPAQVRGEALLAAATVPSAPRDITATATGSTTATVNIKPPTSSGGQVVYRYNITSSPDGITATSDGAGNASVTGLSAATSYTFTVTATNIIGNSAASAASNSITTSP